MIEKVNPSHPDKIADRIAGALVDYCYTKNINPKCAFEVLIGHRECFIIAETSEHIDKQTVSDIVERITKSDRFHIDYIEEPQNQILERNQSTLRCGDNGIFKGVPISEEVRDLSELARKIYSNYPTDGKYILDDEKLIICQSRALSSDLEYRLKENDMDIIINPLGYWTGGTNVDTGAVNRKLGSDMGEAVTGGGLHGKDLSKADVSVNIYAHLKAQKSGEEVNICCAIGDKTVDGWPYDTIVDVARKYIDELGGFEKLAEWGIV